MNDPHNTIYLDDVPVSSLYSHPLAKALLSKVYAWMALSMVITAGMAIYCSNHTETIQWVVEHMLLLCLCTLGIVLVMVFAHNKLTSGALGVLLLAYAGVTGLIFGPVLLVYTQQSLGVTFACTAGTFGVMSVYGICTKRDLSPWGRALMMVLLGLIVAGIINFFWGNGMFDLIVSVVGVVLFSLLTAYDTQKILQAGLSLQGEARAKGAVMGALALYLDFINLFLYLLRFLGEQRK